MSPLFWITGLLLVGLFVMILEVFIPSGGLLGFVSIAAIVAAIATAFVEQGIGSGFLVLAITAVAIPATLAIAFHLFPSTPLGRRIMPSPPEPHELVPGRSERQQSAQPLLNNSPFLDRQDTMHRTVKSLSLNCLLRFSKFPSPPRFPNGKAI